MSYLRSKIVDQAKNWIGRKEADGGHKEIIDVYNSHTPLARGYRVRYDDEWCATFVSACAIKCGYTEIIPTECGCQKMIELFKKMNRWVERDSYVPEAGDVIFYDWQDNGVGDNVGYSDHVGLVERVNGNTIVIIEGNYSNSVKRRSLKVDAKNIRGYGVPKYDEVQAPVVEKPVVEEPKAPVVETPVVKEPAKPAANTSAVKKVTATAPARSKDEKIAGTYVTIANLHMRNDAGLGKKVLAVIPKNTKVRNYGFYTEVQGTKWFYVQVTLNGTVYTGFCSSKYLDKI